MVSVKITPHFFCCIQQLNISIFTVTNSDLPPVREPMGKMAGIPGYMMPGRYQVLVTTLAIFCGGMNCLNHNHGTLLSFHLQQVIVFSVYMGHTIKSPVWVSLGNVCLNELEFYGQVNFIKVMPSRSVY